MRAALILRAPLLIRLRFAADPSGWRPRYHPLRFARIIRCAPRCAARDARTASRMPVPARRLEIADKRFNPRLPGGRRPLRSRPYRRDRPERARSQPEARTARAPSAGACSGARTDRRTSPRQRYAPALRARRRPERAKRQPEARNAPGASQKPAPRQTPPRTRQTPARSPQRARSRADASQKPAPRARPSAGRVWWRAHRRTFTPTDTIRAGASRRFNPRLPGGRRPHTEKPVPRAPVRRRVSWRAHRPAYQPAPTLRAGAAQNAPGAAQNAPGASQKPVPRQKPGRSQPEARTAPEAGQKRAPRQTPPGTRQEPAASAYRALLRFSTITDPVRIRLRRPGIA